MTQDREIVAAPEMGLVVDGIEAVATLPAGGTGIGALIVAGSGPTDANGNNPISGRNNMLRLLSGALAGAGIASIRYDKRGVGRSAAGAPHEMTMTLDSTVADAELVARRLMAMGSIRRIVLIGHSEGALVVTLAAARLQPAALVHLCGPGQPLAGTFHDQIRRSGAPEALKADAGRILEELSLGRPVASVPPQLMSLFRPSVQPFLMSMLTRDPAVELAKVAAPTLIVGGGRDIQIDRDDFGRLASTKPSAETLWLDTMNHVLKDVGESQAANTAAYGDPARPLAAGLAERIVAFIRRHAG